MTNRTDDTTEAERMHALALRTAQRIEAQAAAIRLLSDIEGETTETIVGLDRPRIDVAREVLDLPALNPGDDVADGLDDACDVLAYESALSFEATGSNDGRNGWQVDGCTIVLGTGGPHVEVQWSFDRARVVAFGWFGADRVELPVDHEDVDLVYRVSGWIEGLEG